VSTCCSVVCVRQTHSGKTQTEVSTCYEVLRGEGGATRAHASSKLSSAKPWHGVNVTCTCMERAALGHDTLWCGVGLVLAHSSPCSCSNLAWRVGWKSMPLESTPVYAARCAREFDFWIVHRAIYLHLFPVTNTCTTSSSSWPLHERDCRLLLGGCSWDCTVNISTWVIDATRNLLIRDGFYVMGL
jgi:hypothetical protein